MAQSLFGQQTSMVGTGASMMSTGIGQPMMQMGSGLDSHQISSLLSMIPSIRANPSNTPFQSGDNLTLSDRVQKTWLGQDRLGLNRPGLDRQVLDRQGLERLDEGRMFDNCTPDSLIGSLRAFQRRQGVPEHVNGETAGHSQRPQVAGHCEQMSDRSTLINSFTNEPSEQVR